MGRPKKTEAQRRAERFGELYRVGKAKLGLTGQQVAQMIGVSYPTLLARRNNPDKFSLGDLATLGAAFGWSSEDFASLYHPAERR